MFIAEKKFYDKIRSKRHFGHRIIRRECRPDEANCRRRVQPSQVRKTSETIDGPETRITKSHIETL